MVFKKLKNNAEIASCISLFYYFFIFLFFYWEKRDMFYFFLSKICSTTIRRETRWSRPASLRKKTSVSSLLGLGFGRGIAEGAKGAALQLVGLILLEIQSGLGLVPDVVALDGGGDFFSSKKKKMEVESWRSNLQHYIPTQSCFFYTADAHLYIHGALLWTYAPILPYCTRMSASN